MRFGRTGGLPAMDEIELSRANRDVLVERAKSVIDANLYMTLGTAAGNGRPWVTPVYFTPDGYTEFYWTSSPESTHSRNLEQRPDVCIVIFDSQVPIGSAQAVYATARGELVPDAELGRCAEIFRARVPELSGYSAAEFRPPAELRLYRAVVAELSILVRGNHPVFGRGVDSRLRVDLSG